MFTVLVLTMVYLCVFSFVLGIFPVEWEYRPKLKGLEYDAAFRKKKFTFQTFFRILSIINKPFCSGTLRQRITRDLALAHVDLNPEEFFLIKEIAVVGTLLVTYPSIEPDMVTFWFLMSFAVGYMMPEFWLKGKIKKAKQTIIKELPDAIDLLGLCVNAGLDFMLALKWVIEKSNPSVLVKELNNILQEINVGKTRRDALKDFSSKYDIPEASSFTRTLIQADKMGTSVSEALTLLSEDMRIARFRRGEQLALKAPLKMLVPLLFFIFPVVGILVAGPIMLDFMTNNPLQKMGG